MSADDFFSIVGTAKARIWRCTDNWSDGVCARTLTDDPNVPTFDRPCEVCGLRVVTCLCDGAPYCTGLDPRYAVDSSEEGDSWEAKQCIYRHNRY